MTSPRPSSWMNEVGNSAPRKPSISGPLVPFDLSTTQAPKSSRSQSFPEGPSSPSRGSIWSNPTIWESPSPQQDAQGNHVPPSLTPWNHPTASPVNYGPVLRNYGPPSPSHSTGSRHAYGPDPRIPQFEGVLYCVVNFKGSRADVYIRSEEVTFVQEIRPTDLVMVEADRGYDIGQVVHTTQDRAEAERVAIRHWEKFLHNLLSFSMMYNPNAAPSQPAPLELKTHSSRIKRHAPRFEYINLVRKEHSESKAKRTCQEKASEHQLNMEILDVEFQSDGQKLTVYYFAPQYVVFNALVQDLYKIFKVRIWMQSVTVLSTGR